MSRLASGVRPPSASVGGRPSSRRHAGDDAGVIAGEDAHAQAARAQRGDGARAHRAQRVADAGDAGDASVDRHEDRAEAVGDHRRGDPGRGRRDDARRRPRRARGSRRGRRGRRAGRRCPGRRTSTTSCHRSHDAAAAVPRVAGRRGPRRATTPPRARAPARSTDVVAVPARDRGAALGERAGLVEQHRVDVRRRSSASGFLMKMPARAARISATDMASGTARPERARARHHQQGDDALEGDLRTASQPRQRR